MHFKALDGIRGIAAIVVVLYHIEWTHAAFQKGYLMVDLFFVLSGFVIEHRYSEVIRNGLSFSKFMQSRIARLYPLHLLTLLVLLVAEIALYNTTKTHAVLWDTPIFTFFLNLFLIQCVGIFNQPSWNTSSWSISSEIFVNFVWFIFCSRLKKIPIELVFIVWIGALGVLVNFFGDLDHHTENLGPFNTGVLRCILGFSAGIIMKRIYEKAGNLMSIIKKPFECTLLPIIILITASGISTDYSEHYFDYILAAFTFPAFVLLAALPDTFTNRLFSNSIFRWLGDISFSVYLNHLIAIKIVNFVFSSSPAFTKGIAILLATIAISTITYNYFEIPMRKRINNINI